VADASSIRVTEPRYRPLAVAIGWLGLGAIGLFVASNLVMVGVSIVAILAGSDGVDWLTYVAATERFAEGTLYESAEWWYGWRYSPVAVLPFVLVAPIGETAWRLLLGASLVGLPGRARFLALASYPFWFAIHAGSLVVPTIVVAYLALRGRGWAIGAFFVLALLVPRPLMLPVAAWLLWKHPRWRVPFVVLFVAHAAAVVATGYSDEWLAVLAQVGPEEVAQQLNVAPSALVGLWWLVAAVPLAIWAFGVGRPALAGLLVQPYWLPYYLLILLADRLPPRDWWLAHLTPFAPRGAGAAAEPPAGAPG
jgi:hypothetical protein